MLQLWELPQALYIGRKPELLVAALTLAIVFQELVPRIWAFMKGLQSVSPNRSSEDQVAH